MKRLYEKNPLVFALCWIGVYVVGFSVADGLSASLGLEKCITLPVCVVMTAFLLGWLKKEGLWQYFGLCKGSISASNAFKSSLLKSRKITSTFSKPANVSAKTGCRSRSISKA